MCMLVQEWLPLVAGMVSAMERCHQVCVCVWVCVCAACVVCVCVCVCVYNMDDRTASTLNPKS